MTAGRKTPDRWLLLGIVGTLLAAVGFVVAASVELRSRQLRFSEAALERAQQMLRVRLDALFQGIGEDLREEAVALEEVGAGGSERLLGRWRPLMRSNWSMETIAMADEFGNETALSRDGDGLLLTTSREGSMTGPPTFTPLALRPGGDTPPAAPGRPTHDPRAQVWFSKALGDARSEPVWNLHFAEDGTGPRLQVSFLLRGNLPNDPYRIIMFETDPARLPWLDQRSPPLGGYGAMFLDGDGRVLGVGDARKDPVIAEAERKAIAHWAGTNDRTTFSTLVGDKHFRGLVSPYLLNGLTLYTGTLVDVGVIASWTDAERRGLIIGAAFIALLAILLGLAWLRQRNEDQRVLRQVERSRSQERRLEQALGEREVLNREVHHRVKNNLQVVSSLLNLQAGRLADGPVREEFLRGKRRIDTIALVHHKLYGLKDMRNVDLRLFFDALVEAIAVMHRPASHSVSCEADTGGLHVDQDTAIEIGIILCELLSNCYQHAFPYATGGHVDIRVMPVEGDLHRLVVTDNGKGLADGYADGPGKLGLEIVEALADQLDGSFHVRANGGVAFEVLFRMRSDRMVAVGPATVA